jgi:uncharacterized repeat protein (TIGR03803 family)
MSLSAEILSVLFLASAAATVTAVRFTCRFLRPSSPHLTRALCSLTVLLVVFIPWKAPAQQYTQSVLYNFCPHSGCADGAAPSGTPILDAHGNIYGVAGVGGANNKGVVYELTHSGGTWTESVLYNFCPQPGCADGSEPYYALAFDSQGNLYGTTVAGGSNSGGVVYELTPPPGGSGPWTETVLYNICQVTCLDGSGFIGGLVVDSHGNLYGAADGAGSHGGGLIFELSPNGGGSWTYTVLYDFCTLTNCADGSGPSGGLIFDAHGNLYGPTASGGVNEAGTVFKLSPNGGGWTESVLYSFCPALGCPDGNDPQFALVFDPQGNLYGAVDGGGANAYGGVFELSPGGGGSWTEQVLQSFCPGPTCTDGYGPKGVAADAHNNVFGDTAFGGGQANRGNVFELSPLGGGHWNYNVIYTFCPQQNCNNDGGGEPLAGIVLDGQGNIYGTTGAGGLYSEGAVYELIPAPLIATTTVLTTAPNPSFLGQSVTMTASVSAQNGTIPAGTVAFQSNGTQIGTGTLNNFGIATLNYSGLAIGTDNLVAIYQGSATLAPSTSNTVPQVVNRDNTQTTVTSSPNPSTGGQQVTITASVSPAGPPAPSGTVGFTSNGTAISGCTAVTLTSGTAQCVSSSLAVGTDAIVATYSGDADYAGSNGSVTQIVNPVPEALQFVTLPPCRVVDTRNPDGTFGGPAIPGNTARAFPLAEGDNPCGIPANAVAYSLNVTVVPVGRLSYLTIWPTGEGQPTVSTLNSPDGRTKANAVIIPAGSSSGSVSVFVTNTTNVLLDINGYFIHSNGQTLAFYPLTPCRVADTRNPNGPLGGPYLHAGVERDFPVQSSACEIPSSATAYSLNFTAIPKGSRLGYLTVWPQGSPQPQVSTLNDPTGTTVANAALVPAGNNGAIATYANNDTDLVIDVNGYFAPPGSGGLSFYALTPCRVIDTRNVGNGQPFSGELTVNVVDSACGPPASSAGYVFNATVVPQGALGFLTLWPDSEPQPGVSTLNARDGAVTSNMAIVPNINGKTDAWAQGTTQLILDISGYFAP